MQTQNGICVHVCAEAILMHLSSKDEYRKISPSQPLLGCDFFGSQALHFTLSSLEAHTKREAWWHAHFSLFVQVLYT